MSRCEWLIIEQEIQEIQRLEWTRLEILIASSLQSGPESVAHVCTSTGTSFQQLDKAEDNSLRFHQEDNEVASEKKAWQGWRVVIFSPYQMFSSFKYCI